MPWPSEIRLAADKKTLHLTYEDGFVTALSAEFLRVMSPSAEVQGHTPEEKKTVPGKIDVAMIGVEPVGNYAIRLRFDDLHDSGIYGWDLLYRYGKDQEALFATYLEELETKGLSRHRRGR
jgi:DUF971 family protein